MINFIKEELLGPLNIVSGIVERKHTLPILANVVLRFEENTVALSATDIEIQIQSNSQLENNNSDVFQTTLNCRKLIDVLRNLPDKAAIKLQKDNNKVSLISGKSRFNLQTMAVEDFPVMSPTGDAKSTFKLAAKDLAKLFAQVHYAMAQQDIRYYLNGLLLSAEGDLLKVVATDGHRLGYAEIKLAQSLNSFEVILPRKSVLELMRLLSGQDEEINVNLFETHIEFTFGKTQFLTKLVEGKFPDYKRVIPNNHKIKVDINKISFLSILQRVAIFTNDKFRGVKLNFNKNNLMVSTTNSNQEDANDELEIDYTENEIEIGFNVNYLIDVLSNYEAETISIKMNDANSSIMLLNSDKEDFKYVVMPMRI